MGAMKSKKKNANLNSESFSIGPVKIVSIEKGDKWTIKFR